MAKISFGKVKAIKKAIKAGTPPAMVAAKYGVDVSMVSLIANPKHKGQHKGGKKCNC